MPRYFMHLIDGEDRTLDPDGTEMPARALEDYALLNARDCIAGDAKDGIIDLRYRLEIHDEEGTIVHQLSFADAVKIIHR
jgi:hypothetical protein